MPNSHLKTRYFCTLFNRNYLLKAVAMMTSLKHHCPQAILFILCMDNQTKEILEKLNYPFVRLIPLAEVENEALLKAKSDRGVAEYCWTLSSNFTHYVLVNHNEVDFLTYLDADIYFFSDIEPLFDEIADSSIAIIEHRFTPRLQNQIVNGRFCVEWVSFRKDEQGLACLARWRDQCLEWCYYRLEDGKMGDQKYLDEWPDRYKACHIIYHAGAGIAPWNYAQYKIELDHNGLITVEGEPLIFYHFHQFQLLNNGKFDRMSNFYTYECPEPSAIYERYESKLNACLLEIRAIKSDFNAGLKSALKVKSRRIIQQYIPMWAKELARLLVRY